MTRIALLTADCCQVCPAIAELIERDPSRVALVITSDVYKGKRLGLARQTIRNYRRSGPAFTAYLAYSFVVYFAYARFDRLRSRITRRPRSCLTVAELCARHGVPHLRTSAVNGTRVQRAIAAAKPDAIVVYWFDQILKDGIIGLVDAVINVHAALLPNCRGLFPIYYSATRNRDVYGITAHAIEDTQIDAGPILAQTRVHPPLERSVIYRDAVVNRAGVQMLLDVLDDLPGHLKRGVPQVGGTYFSYPSRADVRRARAQGVRLASMRDFLAVCRRDLPAPAEEASDGDARAVSEPAAGE